MQNHAAFAIAVAACALAGGCTATSTTRVVDPAPVATQRTVYADGTYRDTTVVPATTTTVVPATTTVVPARTTTVYTR
jgi:hypothetical protein